MPKTMIQGYKCCRCGHIWAPRNNKNIPTVCPKCKNPYWNKQRKIRKIDTPDIETSLEKTRLKSK